MYECLKCLEKPLWLANTKLYDVVFTDMFHKYRIRSLKVFLKKLVFLTVSQYPQESIYVESFIRKVTDYWLIKKRL